MNHVGFEVCVDLEELNECLLAGHYDFWIADDIRVRQKEFEAARPASSPEFTSPSGGGVNTNRFSAISVVFYDFNYSTHTLGDFCRAWGSVFIFYVIGSKHDNNVVEWSWQ